MRGYPYTSITVIKIKIRNSKFSNNALVAILTSAPLGTPPLLYASSTTTNYWNPAITLVFQPHIKAGN